jgi:hypothetical protein
MCEISVCWSSEKIKFHNPLKICPASNVSRRQGVTISIRAVLLTSSLLRLAPSLQGLQEQFPYDYMNVCFDVFPGLIINQSDLRRPFRISGLRQTHLYQANLHSYGVDETQNSVPTTRQKSQMFCFQSSRTSLHRKSRCLHAIHFSCPDSIY